MSEGDPHVLAVDGNSLAHRAYHAIVDTDDAVGAFVTAGFMGMLGSVWGHGPFDAIVIALDHPHNQRKVDFPEYKANRTDQVDLSDHLRDLGTHLRATGLVVVDVEGAEGDDVLAATTDACEAREWRCTVLSSDRDLTALVSERVTLLRPRGTMSDLRVYDPAAVMTEYGVRPDQYTDLAALRGDPSDGLVGVNGIGPKTAARLLRDHGDLTGIYANLCHLDPRTESALRAGRDRAERNRLLMSPLPHIEVDVDLAVQVGVDVDAIDAALANHGLGAAGGRFRWAVERPQAPPMAPPPVDKDVPAIEIPDAVLERRASMAAVAQGEQDALF